MEDHRTNRRRLSRGIAATGVSFGAIGTASAQEEQRYVATGGNRGRLGDAGFTVERELAGGSVFVVSGPEDAEDDLGSVRGVNAVTRDFAVELSDPVAETHTTEDAAFSGTQPIPPQANSEGQRVAVQKVMQDVSRRGTVLTVSAGNADADMQHGGRFTLPSSVQGVMTVSATGPNDERAFYSNYGTSEIDVAAPGGGYETEEKTLAGEGVEWPYPTNLVYSTLPVDEGEYGYKAGTSMAAPQVAGLAGLVRELAPDANTNRVENAIARGADLVRGRGSSDFGAGRVNALDTVERL